MQVVEIWMFLFSSLIQYFIQNLCIPFNWLAICIKSNQAYVQWVTPLTKYVSKISIQALCERRSSLGACTLTTFRIGIWTRDLGITCMYPSDFFYFYSIPHPLYNPNLEQNFTCCFKLRTWTLQPLDLLKLWFNINFYLHIYSL